MTSVRLLSLLLAVGLGCGLLSGCGPSASATAEENETHYLKGKARASGLDFQGAIESFEEALVVNPRSAAAHFQLGWLFAEREADPAAAIYHYQKFLQYRPEAENAEIVRQHIFRLKQDLAKAMLPLPATPGVQREFEQLAEENRRLHLELDRLKGFLLARGITATNPVETAGIEPRPGLNSDPRIASRESDGNPGARDVARMSAARTHRVKPGESPMGISRRYNVSLDAFMAANPGLKPRQMQVGQVVNVPAP